jgi:hypothetical protein
MSPRAHLALRLSAVLLVVGAACWPRSRGAQSAAELPSPRLASAARAETTAAKLVSTRAETAAAKLVVAQAEPPDPTDENR